ncbi:hypothetical protein MC7420_5996 [Coleofasciculus chthonoplastes PCC 7420]|uniref:Uncharacterized protein n=1 Tax=Coleofasciculus chthonoplastes PCC 7420 TaxID=118168 RepID=B4W5C3_9CYAN|nr:hypothetical protein MC7420_5996 [Coleofasciculus chthonoplastes PCC 7420]
MQQAKSSKARYSKGFIFENCHNLNRIAILLMHSHPDDHGTGMAKFISEDDVNALVYLNQRYSYMVTVDGTVYRFTRDTPSCSVARIVRELKYSGWVKPET